MRFEDVGRVVTFYYELNGKQEGSLFVVRFSYGRTGFQFNEEVTDYATPEEMRTAMANIKKHVLSLGFLQVYGKHSI